MADKYELALNQLVQWYAMMRSDKQPNPLELTYLLTMEIAIEAVKAQMQCQNEDLKQSEWISVSETLPETSDHYLVTYKNMPYGLSESIGVCQAYYYKGKFDLPAAAFIGKREVLAWMPLPEPYKEVKDADSD